MAQPAAAVTVVPVSSFPIADLPLDGTEIVGIVKDGESQRATVADIAGSALPFLHVTGTADVPILSPIADPALFILKAAQVAMQGGTNATVQVQENDASMSVGAFGFEATDSDASINGLAYPDTDGSDGQALVTDGSGTLTFETVGRVNVPVLAAATRNITATDAGKGIVQANAASQTLTIIHDATENLGDGFVTTLACTNAGGTVVITPGPDVTLLDLRDGTSGTKTITGVGIATIWRTGNNFWTINGSANLA